MAGFDKSLEKKNFKVFVRVWKGDKWCVWKGINPYTPTNFSFTFKTNIQDIYKVIYSLNIWKYLKTKTLWNYSKLWIKTPSFIFLGKNIKNNEEHSWKTHKSSMNIFHPKPSQNHLNLREITYNQTRVHRGSKSHLKNNLTRQTRTQKITL